MTAKLNENTSVPLRIVVPVVATVAGAAWALSVQLNGLRAEMGSMNRQLIEMNAKIEGAWSRQNMGLWVTKFQRDNPAIKIPDAQEGVQR